MGGDGGLKGSGEREYRSRLYERRRDGGGERGPINLPGGDSELRRRLAKGLRRLLRSGLRLRVRLRLMLRLQLLRPVPKRPEGFPKRPRRNGGDAGKRRRRGLGERVESLLRLGRTLRRKRLRDKERERDRSRV